MQLRELGGSAFQTSTRNIPAGPVTENHPTIVCRFKCVGQEDEDVEVPATRQKLLVHVFRDYRFGGNVGGNSIQVAKTTLVKTDTITTAWDNLCSCNAPEGGIFVEADNTGAAPSQN